MKRFSLIPILFLALFITGAIQAEEHTVERGETALQIALDHNLTIEQLSQLNPGIDLEMMLVGDVLIVPEEGTSFEDFRNRRYSELLRINDPDCEILADQSALCLFHAGNLSELPLFDIRLRADVRGQNGISGQAEGSIALMQILPGENLPVFLNVPGPFDEVESASVTVSNLSWSEMLSASFRIPDKAYRQQLSVLPDGISASVRIDFQSEFMSSFQGKKVNVLAAAYDVEERLAGIRSLYSDFYPRLDLTVYSANRKIDSVKLYLEMY